jgi:hypothetical protein
MSKPLCQTLELGTLREMRRQSLPNVYAKCIPSDRDPYFVGLRAAEVFGDLVIVPKVSYHVFHRTTEVSKDRWSVTDITSGGFLFNDLELDQAIAIAKAINAEYPDFWYGWFISLPTKEELAVRERLHEIAEEITGVDFDDGGC